MLACGLGLAVVLTQTAAALTDCAAYDAMARFLSQIYHDRIIDTEAHDSGVRLEFWANGETGT